MKKTLLFFVLFLTYAVSTKASTGKYRLTLRDNPATSIVIGWNQINGNNPVVYYGTTDHGKNWASYSNSKNPSRSVNFAGMNNQFLRLTGLQPNTSYYFVIKDSNSTSRRLWFKTLPNVPTERLAFVSGGDSRNNRTPRQDGNLLVSKLKPHAVFFGGDMTSGATNSQWGEWFDDWQLTISNDGRMYPILATRGNHEPNDNHIYHLFDTPRNNSSVYYALTFGGNLIRGYTLNSEISVSGDQTNWLASDLEANSNVTWKMAQYHKPMRPHVRGKSEANELYDNWAPLFYDNGVNLVVECDAHTVKTTWPVRPSTGGGNEEGFIRDDATGTVYAGEGCWGAPLRSNNDAKTWTRNSGSFNQFKWVFVDQEKIEIRTIKLDNASSVGENSNVNSFAIPSGLDIWSPSNGAVVTIAADGGNNDNQGEDGVVDVRVAISSDDAEEDLATGVVDLTSSDLEMIADATDQVVGVKFNYITIPQGATIDKAYIQFASKGTATNATTLTIKAEDVNTAATFSSTNNNISSRVTTTASTSWTPEAWNVADAAGADQRTPDISNVIQEIVNRNGWASGNNLAIIVEGSGRRRSWSYDGKSSAAPLLHIEYTENSGGGDPNPEPGVNDAAYVSQTVPTTLDPGQTVSVSVTVKNTGTSTWTAAAGHNLGSQNAQGNTTWGTNRASSLGGGESIAPNQNKTFTWNITAPTTPGVYNFQWKMLQEGVEWYGNQTSNVAITVGSSSSGEVSMDWNDYTLQVLDFYDNSLDPRIHRQDLTYNFTSIVGTTEILVVSASNGNGSGTDKPTVVYGGGWGDRVAYGGNNDKSSEIWMRQVTASNANDPGEINAKGAYADFGVIVYPGLLSPGDEAGKILRSEKPNLTNAGNGPWLVLATTDNGKDNPVPGSTIADERFYSKLDDRVFLYLTDDKTFNDPTSFNIRGSIASVGLVSEGDGTPPSPDTVTLTVNGGSGGGSFAAKSNVNIVAGEAPEGQVFDKWVVNSGTAIIANENEASTNVTLGANNAVITATYQGLNNGATFVSQQVPTTLAPGEVATVSVTMLNSGSTTWTLDNKHNLGSQNIQGNTTWGTNRAKLGAAESIAPNAQATFSWDITAPATEGTYNFQWKMVQDGVEWFGDMTTNISIEVKEPTYALTVKSGSGDGQYKAGQQASIVAAAASEGQVFDGWVIESGTPVIADANAISTTLVIGAGAATVTATYRDVQYELTVNNGSGNGTYVYGEDVSIVADVAPSGQEFDTWVVVSGTPVILDPTAQSTTLVMSSADAVVEATYFTIAGINDAEFVSQSVPSSVDAGSTFSVSVTMKNTGSNTWTKTNLYKLGSQNSQGNTTWGANRAAALDANEFIAPNDSMTFTWDITAPEEPGIYNFQWKMLQEQVEWFGQLSENVVITVNSVGGMLDDCDDITGWNTGGTNSLSLSTTVQQGTGSVQMIGSRENEFNKVFTPAYNSGLTPDTAVLEFWYYVSDASSMGTNNQVEIGSAGRGGLLEYNWTLNGLSDGWNFISLDISEASVPNGIPDLNAINWFRLYNFKSGSVTSRIDEIQLLNAPSLASSVSRTLESEETFEAYPNPAKKYVYIALGDNPAASFQVRLFDASYVKVIDKSVENNMSTEYRLDLSQVNPGLHILEVTIDGQRSIKSILIQ